MVNLTVQHVVQKCGHAFEYGVLAILIFRPLRRLQRLSFRRALLFAVILSGTYAAADEWHQSFVPGRSALFSGVVIDTAVAAITIIVLHVNESRRSTKTNR